VSSRLVVLALFPGRLDVVAYEGSRHAHVKRLPITAPSEACEWAKTVRRSAATLKAAIEEMNLAGSPAIVLYRSPTQAVDLAGFAVRSPGQAVEAATLSCLDSLPYSAMSAVCDAAVVGRDAAGAARQSHVAVAAEREDVAEAINDLVTGAELELLSATPVDATIMANLVKEALRDKDGRQGWLYVGEQTSFFVIAHQGTLLLSRRIDLGLEFLATSLTRPIRLPGREEPLEMEPAEARRILHEHGIPERDTVVHEGLGLSGGQIIPLLQPLLQRFIVEIRQSLRFGMSEPHRGDLTIRFTGPGSSIAGLAKLVSEELGVVTTVDDSYRSYDWSKPGSVGEVSDAMRQRRLLKQINLLPREVARRRRMNRLRRWLWTGAAAALVLIAVDGVRYQARVADLRRQSDSLATRISEMGALKATGERLKGTLDAMGQIEAMIEQEVGSWSDYRSYLHELSRITPPTIRFTTIAFHRNADGGGGALRGYAFPSGAESARTDLQAFVAAMRASPLFADVSLGHVAKGSAGDAECQRFETEFVVSAVSHHRYAAACCEEPHP
jgi:Tfp pilus assembly protein PilN